MPRQSFDQPTGSFRLDSVRGRAGHVADWKRHAQFRIGRWPENAVGVQVNSGFNVRELTLEIKYVATIFHAFEALQRVDDVSFVIRWQRRVVL